MDSISKVRLTLNIASLAMVRILLCGDVRGDVPKVCTAAAFASSCKLHQSSMKLKKQTSDLSEGAVFSPWRLVLCTCYILCYIST